MGRPLALAPLPQKYFALSTEDADAATERATAVLSSKAAAPSVEFVIEPPSTLAAVAAAEGEGGAGAKAGALGGRGGAGGPQGPAVDGGNCCLGRRRFFAGKPWIKPG